MKTIECSNLKLVVKGIHIKRMRPKNTKKTNKL